jgi:[ribosomal protein S5]-alanine N-acetyltransferase
MFPQSIQTRRLHIRPIAMSDAPAIFDGYAQDMEVCRYLSWSPHQSIVETETFIRRSLETPNHRAYALTLNGDDKAVGVLGLRSQIPTRVGFGYVLKRALWGQGFTSEALAAAAVWALGQPSIWRFGDVCDVENVASARVMEKAGLVREGVLRRWIVTPNLSDTPRDCFSYAKVR